MTKNQTTSNAISYWEPSAGEKISGIIQDSGDSQNPLYNEQSLMLLKQDNGELVGVPLNRYLRHYLEQNNAALGDSLSVIFQGKEQKNNGRSFNRYSLKMG